MSNSKDTRQKSPNVPTLRFPQFNDSWSIRTIKDMTKISAGATPKTSNRAYWGGNIRWMNSGELNLKQVYEVEGRITQLGYDSTSTKLLPKECVLIGLAGQGKTRGTCAINHIELCTNQSIGAIWPCKQINSLFLYFNLDSRYKELRELSSGDGGRGGLNLPLIGSLKIPLCSISEQQKIATFLSLLEDRIETQNKIIEDLKLLMKRSIDSLLHLKIEANLIQLRKLLTERKDKNINNLPVFSVAVEDGIVNQEEHLGRSFAAKDTTNYNAVRCGDVVYTKSPTGQFPYGVIKQSFNKECVAVSPLYGVYEPKTTAIGSYLHYYFMNPINTNNYLHPLVNKGAKNTMNITNQKFLDGQIPFPENSIRNVVGFLEAIKKKLDTNLELLKRYQWQKKYFLDNLFI